jgi:ABC-type antimicrobial peptide transport system ATPase subunit
MSGGRTPPTLDKLDDSCAGPLAALRPEAGPRRLDLDLDRGGFLVVTGANGSGKTTLIRPCAGLLAPTACELRV